MHDRTRRRVGWLAALWPLLFFSTNLQAQSPLGFYFSAGGTFTSINTSFTVLPTVDAGLIIKDRFYIAGTLSALVPTIRADSLSADDKPLFINLFHGGGRFEYIHNPEEFAQYGGGIMFGGGTISFRTSNPHRNDSTAENHPSYGFSLLEPHLTGQLRLAEGFRIHTRLGWRIPLGRESGSEPAGELGGWMFFAGFRFGLFGD